VSDKKTHNNEKQQNKSDGIGNSVDCVEGNIDTVFDVVIVGAGMVGLSLACALKTLPATQTLNIAIIDKNPILEKSQWQGTDPRVSAIVKSSENLLRNIGAWPYIEHHHQHAYTAMEVWEKDGTASIEFDSAEVSHTELGFITENRVLQRSLYDCLLALQEEENQAYNEETSSKKSSEKSNSLQWFFSDAISHLEKATPNNKKTKENKNRNWIVNFENQKSINARLLIGADGAMSFIRNQLNISLNSKNLEHKAMVCHVSCEEAHNNVARQLFLIDGPLAFLPQPDPHMCSIVWSSSHEKIDQLMALDAPAFNVKLAKAFEYKLGSIQFSDARFSFPLHQRHADSYIEKNAALIGDAAHTIHPLAGQGVNLGFMDAAVLAEEIARAVKRGFDINSREMLRRYERRRRGQVSLMMQSMRGFQQLYATKNADLIGLRNLGVKLVNNMSPIKHQVLKHAMGLSGDLPELAKEFTE